MPPRITRVRWDADNVPWGLAFDENTGIFSGKPEAAGEYTVPVTVETNYGKDTKDVKIRVSKPTPTLSTYGVWAIGSNASTWSNGGSPDTDGFYSMNMPEAYKLVRNYGGFGAKTPDDEFYYCGARALEPGRTYRDCSNGINPPIDSRAIPTRYSDSVGNIEEIVFGLTQSRYSSFKYSYEERYFCVKRYSNGNARISGSLCFYNQPTTSGYERKWHGLVSPGWGTTLRATNVQSLIDGDFIYYSYDRIDETPASTIFSYAKIDGWTPEILKKFPSIAIQLRHGKSDAMILEQPVFANLTKDMLLDGKPENFTQGTIKNAWVSGNVAYVLTEDEDFCSYDYTSQTWNLQEISNVKKV